MARYVRIASRTVLLLGAALAACTVAAAPTITAIEASSPVHAQIGQSIVILAEDLASPVRVFFSDGANPTVEATDVAADRERGLIVVRVPAGAVSGTMKVTANGVDSAPYVFPIDGGTFTQGTRTVSGQVTDGVTPVSGAAVILMGFDECDNDRFQDFDLTDASGNYSLQGVDGFYGLMVLPPLSDGLATGAAEIELSSTPLTENVVLSGGTTVSGRIVLSSLPTVGVANARVEFDSDDGPFDLLLADAAGNFSVTLGEGDYELWVEPSAAASLASTFQDVTILAGGPQDLGDVALDGGVEISGVLRRQSDLEVLPNVEIAVWAANSWDEPLDETISAGDGSYSLVVPPNQTYNVQVWVDESEPYVDAQVNDLVVGGTGVTRDIDLQSAAFISGTVTDANSGTPLVEFQVQAESVPWDGTSVSWARTCMDGSYRLRVPPSVAGYMIGSVGWEENGYVPVTWDGTVDGTFYRCQGSAVSVATAGSEINGIDLPLPPGAAAVSGRVLSQASGCSSVISGQYWVQVDGGTDMGCQLGHTDFNAADGTYRVYGLPHSGLMPVVRVCNYNVPWDLSPQCSTLKHPSDWDGVVLGFGAETSNVDFCLGNTPTTQVAGLTASRSGDNVFFSWDGSDDPYRDRYRLWGASSVVPAGAGSFPTDPGFDTMFEDYSQSAMVSIYDPQTFFLVTAVGVSGNPGPSGSYGN